MTIEETSLKMRMGFLEETLQTFMNEIKVIDEMFSDKHEEIMERLKTLENDSKLDPKVTWSDYEYILKEKIILEKRCEQIEEKLKVDKYAEEFNFRLNELERFMRGELIGVTFVKEKKEGLSFGEAFKLMKQGKKLTHVGFAKGWIFLDREMFRYDDTYESEKSYSLDVKDIEATDWMVVE